MAMAMGTASFGADANASPWSVRSIAVAAPSSDELLQQSIDAYDAGKYRDAAELADASYRALPLEGRASPYGENVVFQATTAYREAWLIEDDATLLQAGSDLLQQHVDDYTEHGRHPAPSNVTQELVRWERMTERCRQPEGREADISAPLVATADGPISVETERPRLRAGQAAVVGGAGLALGAGLLSAFVFGLGPANDPPTGAFSVRISTAHLVPAIPMALVGGIVGALGTHALVDRPYIAAPQKLGIALTVVGGLGVATGVALLAAGAAAWPRTDDDAEFDLVAGKRSVDLRSAGLAVSLSSLGVLGPGIGALIAARARRKRGRSGARSKR